MEKSSLMPPFRRFVCFSVVSTAFFSFFFAALAFSDVFIFDIANVCAAETSNDENAAAFDARLFRDWLLQDAANDADLLFSDAEKSDRERTLVDGVLTALENGSENDETTSDSDVAQTDSKIAELRETFKKLTVENVPGVDARWRELYRNVCQIRRVRRLAVLVETAPTFVYTKHYVIGASHYAYTEDVTDEAFLDYSCNRRPGASLCRATVAPNGTVSNEVLVETGDGTLRDPDVSWDGKKIVFSMRDNLVDDDFHLYEYDVDAKTTRAVTAGKGVADIEPIYLPNGELLFGSTRCAQITDCFWTEVSNFYTCDTQGRFLRRVSTDQVTVNYPKILDDGRIIYTRWDYNDRGQIFPQPLFTMNADGTGQTEFYGNNSYFPTTIMHARGIPGTNKVVAIASGHHTYQQGKLLLIDRSKGTQENSGATLIAPIRETPAVKIDAYGQEGELFQYPFPLDETNLLVAYLPEGTQGWSFKIPYGIYWFDPDGRRELLAFDPAISCGQPIPLAEREIPTIRASQVDLTKKTGKFYVQDVYEGPGLAGIERGTIKRLRVVALDFRAAGIRSNGNGGPAGGALVSTPPAINQGTWDVKKVLGEIPVEEDGSAYFEVPASTPVYFQLLDERGDVVQTMRSWSTLQPGETFGCVGCHEPKGSVIENNVFNETSGATAALQKGVATPTPFYFPGKGEFQNAGFSFVRDVQPILDTHCVACHTGAVNTKEQSAPFSLLGDAPTDPKQRELCEQAGRRFSQAYLNLTQNGTCCGNYVQWINIQEGPAMLPPYCSGAAKSPLLTQFRAAPETRPEYHRDVRLDDVSLRKIALWIDLLVPFCGDYAEENCWTLEERAQYEYYLTKREKMARIAASNVEKKIESNATGIVPTPETFASFEFGGLDVRKRFYENFPKRQFPSLAKKTGAENVYRNVALNPFDIQGDAQKPFSLFEATTFPHATSNSVYAHADEFAAKNVIDGNLENHGHGPAFPSWGPNLRTDLWLDINFGCEVEIDKIVIYLRADFPHDVGWTSGTLAFSDGTELELDLKETAEPQTFEFPKRRVTSVRLTNLKCDFPLRWKALTEVEVWGTSVEEK